MWDDEEKERKGDKTAEEGIKREANGMKMRLKGMNVD